MNISACVSHSNCEFGPTEGIKKTIRNFKTARVECLVKNDHNRGAAEKAQP